MANVTELLDNWNTLWRWFTIPYRPHFSFQRWFPIQTMIEDTLWIGGSHSWTFESIPLCDSGELVHLKMCLNNDDKKTVTLFTKKMPFIAVLPRLTGSFCVIDWYLYIALISSTSRFFNKLGCRDNRNSRRQELCLAIGNDALVLRAATVWIHCAHNQYY
jgi:hypothetical protein